MVQCKKYASRLSRPQVIKEIIKFLLFATLDRTILPNAREFEYKLYVSNDFSEPAINLINSYKSEISIEIQNGNVDDYISEIVNEYESFKEYRGKEPISEIKSMLNEITLTSANATELSARVNKYDNLLSLFFNVKTIVDLEKADSLIRNALDDFGLKYLTDADLKKLQDRIGNTKEENRINLGFVDFFGYNVDFFRFLKGDGFKDVITSVMDVKSILDKQLINFVVSKINEFILVNITERLLNNGKIHTFSVGVAAPYLFKRLTMTLSAKSLPKSMLPDYYPQFSMTKNELVQEIAEELFNSSERVMNGDYSQLAGSPEDVMFKIQIFEHIHRGLNCIDDAKVVFNRDMQVIQPVLDEIEDEINTMLEENRTVVIKDSSFFDDDVEMKAFVKTLKAIDSN